MEPPRSARWILDRVLDRSEGPVAAGELAEAFRTHAARHGINRARRWYWRQVRGFVLRAPLLPRLRARREGTMGWLDDVGRDVQWALRGLRRRPTFAAIAIATLALGIGANSAIFTLLQAHFFTPLPYGHPLELVLLWETDRNSQDVTTVAPGNYFTWRDNARSFADIAAFNVDVTTLSDGDGPAERVVASYVAPNFFDVLEARPELGTGFDEASARAADGRVVILGHALWARRYGADPALVGRDIRVGGLPYTVVGVMPASFRQPERALTWQTTELWRPTLLDDQRNNFGSRYLRTVARLRAGVTVEDARAEMAGMATRMAEAYPEQNGGRSILVRTLDEYLLGDARPTLLMLLGAGLAVFLVVCANVANLTLARGEERRREFALRAAMGSGRGRLVRQLLVEGVVLALAGALVGTVLVYGAQGVLQAVQARFFSGLVDVRVDLRVVAFTALVALAASVLFGLPAARAAGRADVREALVEGGSRSGSGRGTGTTRSLLVVGQVALATTLLVVAALLTRSFNQLVAVPPGFQPEGVLTFDLSAPRDREGREGIKGYYRDVWNELEALPGITGVGMVSDLPFTTENRWTELAFHDRVVDPTDPIVAEYHTATPEYFDVMGIPLVAGTLPASDWELHLPMPVVVNQDMAQRLWPDGGALGATFDLQWNDTVPMTVVGIVGNVLDDGFAGAPEPIFYA
ncbi:MAG TPA: ABC transporter permease, partial [Longimicrobiales bacterium]|nr:ABC transporter permease [Longimicrobiales bacterium]